MEVIVIVLVGCIVLTDINVLKAFARSSLVEGDEQPDRTNSQACMEICQTMAAKLTFGLSQIQ